MSEFLTFLESLAGQVNANNIDQAINLVEKLIALVESTKASAPSSSGK